MKVLWPAAKNVSLLAVSLALLVPVSGSAAEPDATAVQQAVRTALEDSKHLLASSAESAEQLETLNWMVGSWMYEAESQARVETTVAWVADRRLLSRSFRVYRDQDVYLTGVELVGFDPAKQAVCSRVYMSNGERGEAVWTKDGNTWTIRQTGTLTGGERYTGTNIIRFVNDNSFVWQAKDRLVDGQPQPDTREVLVARTGTIDTTSDAP